MALTFTKQLLSASSNGQMIQVDATASPGTTVHTVQATATTAREMVYVHAVNSATGTRTLTLEIGATGADDQLPVDLQANEGLNLVLPGWPFTGTGSIVRAHATATGEIRLGGWINRAT